MNNIKLSKMIESLIYSLKKILIVQISLNCKNSQDSAQIKTLKTYLNENNNGINLKLQSKKMMQLRYKHV